MIEQWSSTKNNRRFWFDMLMGGCVCCEQYGRKNSDGRAFYANKTSSV